MPSWALNGHKYMDEYISIKDDSKYRDAKFKEYNVECVIVNKNKDKKSIVNELIKNKWTIAVADKSSLLLLRP
jgi:hypothetical protein